MTTISNQPILSKTTAPNFGIGRTIRLGIIRIGYEVKTYFRASDQVFFTFIFPIMMLGIFAVAFSGTVGGAPDGTGGVSNATYYLPGLVAAGILLSGTQSLGIEIAVERSDGTLKRLGGSPLPVVSYFMGKIGQVLVTSILQVMLLLAVAHFAFNVNLPTSSEKWLTFTWIYLLSILASAVLGIAVSHLPRSGKTAVAVIVPPVLLLQFISGVYLPFTNLPEWLQNIASIFPLKWIAQGMRSVFLPSNFEAAEQGGTYSLALVAIVLTVWLVIGLLLCRIFFRWIRKDS